MHMPIDLTSYDTNNPSEDKNHDYKVYMIYIAITFATGLACDQSHPIQVVSRVDPDMRVTMRYNPEMYTPFYTPLHTKTFHT